MTWASISTAAANAFKDTALNSESVPYGRNFKKKGALETKESFTSHHKDKFERISAVERERKREHIWLSVKTISVKHAE